MPTAEIELTQDLVEALESLLDSGLTTVEPAVVLAAYLDALAKSYGLSESVSISEDPLERVDPPSLALVTLRHYLAGGGELSDSALRTELYKVFVELSSDAGVRRELNRNTPLSEQGLLYLAQIYWNLEGTSDRPALPIRPGKVATGGARIDADIPAPGGNKDYAAMLWTARVKEKGPYKSSGQSFRKQGARLAVLAAKRLVAARAAPSSTSGEGSFRNSEIGAGKPKAITWAIDGGPTSDRRPRAVTTGTPGTDLLITSRARARFAVDSFEQDLRYAIERFVPDELPPEDTFGPMYDKLLARRASADAADTGAMTAYLHPQESRDVLLRHADALPPDLVQLLESTDTALLAFIPVWSRVMRGRPLQPDDLDEVGAFVERFRSPYFPGTTAALGELAADSGKQPNPRAGSGPLDLVPHNLPEAGFNETGLLGREQLVSDAVAKVKRRRYPIMLRGEGGIGKTALALEVAWRFVDDPDSPFDAVLWTSLKTEQLTTAGVQELSHALRDVAGVAAVVGTKLDPTFQGGIEELGDVIGDMTTLIVIDNLETLHGDEFFALDDALRDRDVTYLLTSRKGTGDRTDTLHVGPLDEESATRLFRTFARISGSPDLAEWTAEKISATVRRLHYSPLQIRYFILSVAAGKPVSDTIRNQDELLRFCLGNVVEDLGEDETLLLQVLRVLDRPISFSELAVISEIDVDSLARGQQRLDQLSLLVRTPAPTIDDSELLSLSSTARSFLPPVPESDVLEDVYRREREYNEGRANERQWIADRGRYFDPNLIFARSTSDGPVAHLLRRALRESKTGNPTAAAATLQRARAINPGYFEVDRVEAFFASTSGRTVTATALFRSALSKCESEEERCWVGYFYSAHLGRAVRDIPGAISLAEATHNYFKTYDTAHHLGNFYFWNSQFTQGEQLIRWALEQAPTAEFKRKATTSLVRCLQQWSDADLTSNSVADALTHALRAFDLGIELHDSGSTDDKLVRAVNGVLVSALKAARRAVDLSPEDERALAHAVARTNDDTRLRRSDSWGLVEVALATLTPEMLEKVAPGISVTHIELAPRERLRGTVVNVREKYGFIAHPRFPENIFFQRGWLWPPTEMEDLSAGSPVDFTPSKNNKGQDQARNVMLASRDAATVPLDRPFRDPRSAAPPVDDDPALTEIVADEVRRIIGEFTRPAAFAEVHWRLSLSLGQDATRTVAKFKTFKAFLAYAVPTAQILSDRPPGWVYPAGVPLDHPRPESWFAAPGVNADAELSDVVAREARRVVGDLARPTSLAAVSAHLIRSLGPDAKRAWAKPKSFKAFLAEAVPTARIFSDGTGWVVPEGVQPDPPLLDPWFAAPQVEADETLMAVVDDVCRILGEFTRPAKLVEVSALLSRALGDDAKPARDKFRSFKAFLEYAVPTAQIVTDPRHGLVVLPESVSSDQTLPDTWFTAPLIDDNPELTETVANETRRIVSELTRPAKLTEVSALLTRSLGEDAKGIWSKYKTVNAFLAYAVPTAQIVTDPRHGLVVLPESVSSDQTLPDTWFTAPLIDDNPELTKTVATETRRIIGQLNRPAKLTEVSALLTRSLGEDAKRIWTKHKTVKAFLEYVVPTAQIVTDLRHGLVVLPEGVPPDQPLPDTWFAAPLIDDNPALTMTVANETRRIVSELTRPAKLTEVSALLTRSLGEDAKRTWSKYKTINAFLAYAVPTAQIVTDPRHGRVVLPDGVPPDQPLPDTWFAAPLIDDDPALTQTVANEARRIIGELSGPASLAEVSGDLIRSLGPDAKRAWAKPMTFKTFLAHAVPTAKIVTDRPPGWVYPEGVQLDHTPRDPSPNGAPAPDQH